MAKITAFKSGTNHRSWFWNVAQITQPFFILGIFWRKLHTPVIQIKSVFDKQRISGTFKFVKNALTLKFWTNFKTKKTNNTTQSDDFRNNYYLFYLKLKMSTKKKLSFEGKY